MALRFNVEQLANIHKYHNELQQQIDEADWMGEYDNVNNIVEELKHVKYCMDNGDVWYPLF